MKGFLIVINEEYKINSIKNYLHHGRDIDKVIEVNDEELKEIMKVVT